MSNVNAEKLISMNPNEARSATTMSLFAEAYLDAGIRVARDVKLTLWSDAFHLLPALFLIRHGVELCLKAVISGTREAGSLLQTDVPADAAEKAHPLRPLKAVAEPLAADYGAPLSAGFLELVGLLDDLDASSFELRYPTDKKLKPSAFLKVDVDRLERVFALVEEARTVAIATPDPFIVPAQEVASINAELEAEMAAEHEAEMASYYRDEW